MRSLTLTCGALLLAGGLLASEPAALSSFQGPFQAVFDKETPHAAGQSLHSVSLIKQFYENRAFTLVWSKDGNVTDDGVELMNAIENAHREGLEPAEYH